MSGDVHLYPSIAEVEAGGLTRDQDQPGLHSEFQDSMGFWQVSLSKNKQNQNKTKQKKVVPRLGIKNLVSCHPWNIVEHGTVRPRPQH